ncbi:MAG: aminoglycoside phosphotransferase family protein [Nocardioidaceae bacterium]
MKLPYDVPPGLLAQAELGPLWADWLDRLPVLFDAVVADWELAYDGPPRHGFASLVAPVRTLSGRPAVLKVTLTVTTSRCTRRVALQHWNGRGTVRLLPCGPAPPGAAAGTAPR